MRILCLVRLVCFLGIGTSPLAVALDGALGSDQVAPIEIARDAKTSKAFEQTQRAWTERVLALPFRERGKGQPWAGAAAAFVGHALDAWPGEFFTANSAELLAEGEAVLASGCKDLLVVYLTARFRYLATGEWHGLRVTIRNILPAVEKLPGSRALAWVMMQHFLEASAEGNREVSKEVAKLAQWAPEVFTDGTYLPEDEALFVRHVVDNDAFDKHTVEVVASLAKSKLSSWARATLEGASEAEAAWDSRGTGWASTVKPEGWRGFEAHLASARKALVAAWKERPDQPMAASIMIIVMMGGDTEKGETERLWFDRAIAAECDYPPAYDALARSSLPRWGGSHELMLKYAEACLATERFDTKVPDHFFRITSDMTMDVPLRKLYRMPRVAPGVLRISATRLVEVKTAPEKRMRQCLHAVNAWLAGDYQAAAKSLAEAGPGPLHRYAAAKLKSAHTDETNFRGSVAVLSSPGAEPFLRGEAAFDRSDLASAKAAFAEALPLTKAAGADYLRGWIEVIQTEEKLAAGETVEIAKGSGLRGWTARAGNWNAGDAGALVCRDTDDFSRLVYGARVGAEFEMKGQIAFQGTAPQSFFGLMFGFQFQGPWEHWQDCSAFLDSAKSTTVGLYAYRQWSGKLPFPPFELRKINDFIVRVEHGNVTWQLNGKVMHDHVPLLHEVNEDAQVGIVSFLMEPGTSMTVHHLAVRRLK